LRTLTFRQLRTTSPVVSDKDSTKSEAPSSGGGFFV